MNKPIASPAPSTELSNSEYREMTRRLRTALGGLYPAADRETLDEVVQDAWAALYAHCERTGERLQGARRAKFLHVAARNGLIDRWRQARVRRTNLSGQGAPLDVVGEPVAPGASPEEEVVNTATEREVEGIVSDALTDHEAAIFRCRFFEGLRHREISERLGVSERAVGKALGRGIDKLVGRLCRERHWIWQRGQRRMIVAVLAGTASKEELAQARKLAGRDPAIAQALHDTGTALHGATVAIPTEIALQSQGGGVFERFGDAVANLTGRSNPAAEPEAIATQVASSGAGRGAGAAGAGLLAKLGALGGAGKAAVACVATTGAAATCVVTGVVPGVGLGGAEERERPPAAQLEAERDLAPTPDATLAEREPGDAPPAGEAPERTRDEPSGEEKGEVEQTEPGLAVPQNHSAQVQQEFDLAGAGQPVTSSSGGSGGNEGGRSSGGSGGGSGAKNASGREVSQEFGP